MTEATVATSQNASGVIAKADLPVNGKADLLISMRDLWKTTTWAQRKCMRCMACRSR